MRIFSTIFRYRDKASPDNLGLYPQNCHVKALPERRYLWTTRVLVIFAAINISMNIVLSLVIFLILPLRSVAPNLYEQRYDNLKSLRPQNVTISPLHLLNDMLIRNYVILRHSFPDKLSQASRIWNENSQFRAYCSDEIYKSFSDQLEVNLKRIRKYILKGIRRSVDIKDIEYLGQNLYAVRFNTITSQKNSEKKTISKWKAYMRIGFFDVTNELEQRVLLNPYGFKVLSYYLSYIGKE